MKKINAIVIDDSEIDRYLAHRVLSRSGLFGEIKEFCDGSDANNFLEAGNDFETQCGPHPPPTLFLIDINMPRMGGFELLESINRLRAEGKINAERDCVVMMLTSSDYSGDKEKALNYDVVKDYIQKPIDKDKLRGLIERHYPGVEINL